MYVKIIKTRHSELWYADKIGETLEVRDDRDGHSYSCVKTGHGIHSSDAVVVRERCITCIKRKTCLINNENKF